MSEKTLTPRFVKERHYLKDVIPIDTPYEVGFFIGDVCNLKCHYCVHSLTGEAYRNLPLTRQLMDVDLFRKCADSLTLFPRRIQLVQIASLGEPLLNPNLPEYIKYLKQLGCVDSIKMVTNGIALNEQLIDNIIDAGLDRIEISIQGFNSDMYKNNCGKAINFDNFYDNLKYLYNNKRGLKIYMQTLDTCISGKGEREKFIETFSSVCDYINIAPTMPVDDEVDYSKYFDPDQRRNENWTEVCPQAFYELFILSDGTVIPCCHSLRGRRLAIGNINDENLLQIWNGKKRMNLLKHFLKNNRRDIQVCKTCISPNFANRVYDCIDGYRKILLKRMEQMEKR